MEINMNLKKYLMLSLVLFVLLSCNVFDTSPSSSEEDLFQLSIKYDNERIVHYLPIRLDWSDITIENYKETRITRLNKHRDPLSYPVGTTDNGWIRIFTTNDPFQTSYTDTVWDDAEFLYRIDYVDRVENYIRAEEQLIIRPTSQITIPTDFNSIKTTVESYIIDNGDSVLVLPGIYNEHSFSFGDKTLYLIGTGGAENTIINWVMRMADVEPLADTSFVTMRAGLIQGVGLIGSSVMRGGGINASGNSNIKNCIIRKNFASDQPVGLAIIQNAGFGGGLHLSGQVIVENCIIDSNMVSDVGGGIYIDSYAQDIKIINCVLNANDLFSDSPNVAIQNSVILGVSPTMAFNSNDLIEMRYSHIGHEGLNFGATNIIGDINFARLLEGPDYHLREGSVCINAGNPDPTYNDRDGSRNDIGVYGGPFGE